MFVLTSDAYVWFKAFHIVSVIAWLAGLLYLPKLFVYHCDSEPGTLQSETFKTMERKLLLGIMNPSLIAVIIFGSVLLFQLDYDDFFSGWLITKLILVVFLIIFHVFVYVWYKDFSQDQNTKSSVFYRWVNEAPAVLMIGIVILAVVKP